MSYRLNPSLLSRVLNLHDGANRIRLQEKGWTLDDEVPEVKAVWWEWYARMQGWKQAEKQIKAERAKIEQEAPRRRMGRKWKPSAGSV